jgi:hypothetical protein
MIPNVLHCHDWAYRHAWDISAFPPDTQHVVRQIRSHIIGDWVIHYGEHQTHSKAKCGWAYRRMALADRRAYSFFDQARARDLLTTEATDPRSWSKKRKLDFAHSITEYALDFILAESVMTPSRLRDVKTHLAAMATNHGRHGRAWLDETFARLGAHTDQPDEMLGRTVEAVAHDAEHAATAEEFAIGTTLRKYGFRVDRRGANYVRRFLEQIAGELNHREARELCGRIAQAIAAPRIIYTGPWQEPQRAAPAA